MRFVVVCAGWFGCLWFNVVWDCHSLVVLHTLLLVFVVVIWVCLDLVIVGLFWIGLIWVGLLRLVVKFGTFGSWVGLFLGWLFLGWM